MYSPSAQKNAHTQKTKECNYPGCQDCNHHDQRGMGFSIPVQYTYLPSQVYRVLSTDTSPNKAYYVQVLKREVPTLKYSVGELIR